MPAFSQAAWVFGAANADALKLLPNVAIAPGDAQKKRGRRVELRPKLSAACGLGGRGIGRHQLLMSAGIAACRAVRKRGGTPRSALTISKKQFTINLASSVQLG
jgi:hypothetical protein